MTAERPPPRAAVSVAVRLLASRHASVWRSRAGSVAWPQKRRQGNAVGSPTEAPIARRVGCRPRGRARWGSSSRFRPNAAAAFVRDREAPHKPAEAAPTTPVDFQYAIPGSGASPSVDRRRLRRWDLQSLGAVSWLSCANVVGLQLLTSHRDLPYESSCEGMPSGSS